MQKSSDITVLATYSTDRLINENGTVLNERSGGPALFISSALKDENIKFDSINPEPTTVEILITKDSELGQIPNPPKSLRIDFSIIQPPTIIISTLLDEIELNNISSFKGQVFLDAQGYVRDGRDFGKQKKWRPSQQIAESIFCLKATDRELKNIDATLVDALKNKMLLVTHGEKGSTLYCKGKKYTVAPKEVISVDNTIGAGDTLFAYFVSQITQDKSLINGLEYATTKTSEFLSQYRQLLS